MPNMIITKANAKESLGELICLAITTAKYCRNTEYVRLARKELHTLRAKGTLISEP